MKWQCEFCEGYISQQTLLALEVKWPKHLDTGETNGALLTDLTKTFDCLSHDIFIAKLAVHGFDHNPWQSLKGYLIKSVSIEYYTNNQSK